MRRPWKLWRSLGDRQPDAPATPEPDAGRLGVEPPPVEIAPNDPLVAYFQSAGGPVDLDSLELESPALDQLRATGSRMVVPLVSQGELIGLLNLGPRRSEQEYSADDRKLLNDLAGHAAPAVRVAQLVREQEAEVRQRERIEPELPVEVRVVCDDDDVKVRITDQGGDRAIPEVEAPDLEAKLAGLQTPRGW